MPSLGIVCGALNGCDESVGCDTLLRLLVERDHMAINHYCR